MIVKSINPSIYESSPSKESFSKLSIHKLVISVLLGCHKYYEWDNYEWDNYEWDKHQNAKVEKQR